MKTKTYTITTYDMDDYRYLKDKIDNMSNKELADFIRYVARGHLSDYNYTGTENDFYNYKEQMIMKRVANILEKLDG